MRRILLTVLLTGAAGLAERSLSPSSGLVGLSPGMARGADLILVTLDTTRADHLGCYGGAHPTPTLDGLAARSFRFTQAIAVAPVTLPAHASILTGLYPPRHGLRANGEFRLGGGPPTLAQLLKATGYRTAAFVSSFILDARFGLDRGFETYDDRVRVTREATFPAGTPERSARETTDAALAWLALQKGGDRLFLWVHYFDPHVPYQPPEPFASRFAGEPYDGEIAFMDRELGRLLAGLSASRRLDAALVVVIGDHGESLGEHGESTHSIFVYDSVVRVPFLLRPPGGLPSPRVVADQVVSQVDLLPTLLDLLGAADGSRRDGVSLLSAPAAGRAVYAESLVPLLDFGWAPLHALRRLGDKLIQAPRREYYDLASDPGEAHNLARPGGSLAEGERHLAMDLGNQLREWEKRATPAAASPLSEEERARLAALGYLSGAGSGGGGTPDDPKDRIGIATALIAANQLMAANRLAEAESLLARAARESPRDRSVLQALGKLHLRQGKLRDAERELRAFTEIRPKADVSLLLAQILILDGRLAEAERLLGQAETLDPRHGGVQIAWGDLEARKGRTNEAAARYRRAAEIDPYRATGPARSRLNALSPPGKP